MMTKDLINAITEVEAQAEQIKAEAIEKANAIVADAEKDALAMERSAAETCKEYRETQNKAAMQDAEAAYLSAIEKKKTEAKEYCREVLENADGEIGKIVGRIIGVDR